MISLSAVGETPADRHALKELALLAPRKVEELTLTLISNDITSFEAGDTTASLYGVAFDIGTTTVAVRAGFIELAGHQGFQSRFIKNLSFPGVI